MLSSMKRVCLSKRHVKLNGNAGVGKALLLREGSACGAIDVLMFAYHMVWKLTANITHMLVIRYGSGMLDNSNVLVLCVAAV